MHPQNTYIESVLGSLLLAIEFHGDSESLPAILRGVHVLKILGETDVSACASCECV